MLWNEIIEHLHAHYRLGSSADGWVEMWWRFRDDELAMDQHQTIRLVEALGEPAVLIAAEVTAGDALAPDDALRHNATLGIGALAQEDDRLVLRAVLAAADLTPGRLDRALQAIAHEAARLSMSARAVVLPEMFSHYC